MADYNVNTIAELRALTGVNNTETVEVAGYYSASDWGTARTYTYNATSTLDDNNGTIIQGAMSGRFIMDHSDVNYVDALWFGIRAGSEAYDTENTNRHTQWRWYIAGLASNKRGRYPAGTTYFRNRLHTSLNAQYANTEWYGYGMSFPGYRTSFGGNADLQWYTTEKNWLYSVEYLNPSANNAELSVSFAASKLTVSLATDGVGSITTTANDIIRAVREVDLEPAVYNELQVCEIFMVYLPEGSDGTGVVSALAEQSLTIDSDATVLKTSSNYTTTSAGFFAFLGDTAFSNFAARDIEVQGDRAIGNVTMSDSIAKPIHENVVFKNMAFIDTVGGYSASSNVNIRTCTSLMENCFVYGAYRHGIGQTDRGYNELLATYRNVYIRRNGDPSLADFGIDTATGSRTDLVDCYIMHNPQGHKTALSSDATYPHYKIKMSNVLFRENWRDREAGGGITLNQTGTKALPENESVYELDNVLIVQHPNASLWANLHSDVQMGRVAVYGKTGYFGGRITADELYLNNARLELGNGANWTHSREARIKYIKANGSSGNESIYTAMDAPCEIDSGEINSGALYGINARYNNTVSICDVTFTNNATRDINSFDGDLTLIYSNLSGITHNATTTVQRPSAETTSPLDEANIGTGNDITIEVTAAAYGGRSISKIEFYSNGEKVGEDTSSPYSHTITSPPDGVYVLSVVATDSGGYYSCGLPEITVTVGTPASITSPTLLSPSDTATGVSINTGLSWGAVSGAEHYKVQVSKNSDMSLPSVDVITTGTSYNLTNLDNETIYYWQITAVAGTDEEESEIWSFTTATAGVPNAPILSSPENGAASVSGQPTFGWSATDNTDDYAIEVSESAGFGTPVIDVDGIGTNEYTPTVTLDSQKTYYWRVRSRNTDGYSDYSSVWSFTVAMPKQYLRPISVISNDGWTAAGDTVVGALATVAIDNDTYIYATAYDAEVILKLTEMEVTMPGDKTGWYVNLTAKIEGSGLITVVLYENVSTEIESWLVDDLTESYTTKQLEVTNAANVTDITNLYLALYYEETSS
jgi:hypothetical protein